VYGGDAKKLGILSLGFSHPVPFALCTTNITTQKKITITALDNTLDFFFHRHLKNEHVNCILLSLVAWESHPWIQRIFIFTWFLTGPLTGLFLLSLLLPKLWDRKRDKEMLQHQEGCRSTAQSSTQGSGERLPEVTQ
jgi:hypothetical protein